MQWKNNNFRYGVYAITLHWLMALIILLMLASGLILGGIERIDGKSYLPITGKEIPFMGDGFITLYNFFNIHKSLGITLLALAMLRLLVRIGYGAPLAPIDTPLWQKFIAKFTHFALYFLMIAIPLTGYLYASTTGYPIDFFLTGIFIPTISALKDSNLESIFHENHELLADALMALLVLHIGAALKHHFRDKDNIMWRMLPIIKNPDKGT